MPASVELQAPGIAVEPGETATVSVRVRNTGQVVDEFTFEVLGDAASWASVEPARLPLFPGADGETRVVFRPPRGSSPVAGQIPFGVRVRSREDATFSYVAEGRVQVGIVRNLSARITPRTSTASRTSGRGVHRVRIENAGNAPTAVRVSAADPDELVAFDIRPSSPTVAPGTSMEVVVAATARQRPIQGASQSLPFQVTISADEATPIVLDGALLRRPLLSFGLLPLAAIAVAIVAVAAIFGRSILGANTPSPSPSASAPVVQPTSTAAGGTTPTTAPPTPETATVEPSAVEATAQPTPEPTATISVPEAAASFARLSVEDPDNSESVVREIRFSADGPGTVSATIGRIDGGSRLRICLQPEGADENCSSVGEGTVSAATGEGSTTWILTIAGDELGMAPAFDLGLDFTSNAPQLALTGFRFSGASAATNGIDVRIRARNPGPM
ncbi:MAG TPA: hypothetical protein VIV06_04780, partial [Candidatus Limnocylindrales bacterium]